jgi:hypothetical protein
MMFTQLKPIKNEQGYFLMVATLMLLALLTILSIAASNTANTEIQIARNNAIYQRNLYLAEGAALEAVDRLQYDPSPRELGFVVPGLKVIDEKNFVDHWDGEAQNATIDASGQTRFVAGYEGTPPGFSLSMGESRVHSFAIYGRTEKQGESIIKIGYRKVY